MSKHEKIIAKQRLRRKRHVRHVVRGTAERPRLSVFRSNKHIYCQVIDDHNGVTLASASTRDKGLRGDFKSEGNAEAAKIVGKMIAERTIGSGVKHVCFDRGPYKYHGRVAALANAAREAGLAF